jgi:hypothetical protein
MRDSERVQEREGRESESENGVGRMRERESARE